MPIVFYSQPFHLPITIVGENSIQIGKLAFIFFQVTHELEAGFLECKLLFLNYGVKPQKVKA